MSPTSTTSSLPLWIVIPVFHEEASIARTLAEIREKVPLEHKALVVYETAFWREAGLSGRIASRAGPLVEAHDLCGVDGTPAAIFGFVGWPHELREQHRPHLQDAIIAQLVRCLGSKAANPLP